MGLVNADLNNPKLHDDFDYDDHGIIIQARLMAWCNRYKQHKTCKKRDKQRIDDHSIASNKMVGLVHVRIWKKNKTIFD